MSQNGVRNIAASTIARIGPTRNARDLSRFPSGVRSHPAPRLANCDERDRVFESVMARIRDSADPRPAPPTWRHRLAIWIAVAGDSILRLAEWVRG
jgi:hypothetical protein